MSLRDFNGDSRHPPEDGRGLEGNKGQDQSVPDIAISSQNLRRRSRRSVIRNGAFDDVFRLLNVHRNCILRECGVHGVPCLRILELGTTYPTRNFFDALPREMDQQNFQDGSGRSLSVGESFFNFLFLEGPDFIQGASIDNDALARPHGIVYFRCLIIDLLLFVIRRYNHRRLMDQFQDWLRELTAAGNNLFEENLESTLGCIVFLINLLETDTGIQEDGQRPGAQINNVQRDVMMLRCCVIHNRDLERSVTSYLKGIVSLFSHYFNAKYRFQNVMAALRNRGRRLLGGIMSGGPQMMAGGTSRGSDPGRPRSQRNRVGTRRNLRVVPCKGRRDRRPQRPRHRPQQRPRQRPQQRPRQRPQQRPR